MGIILFLPCLALRTYPLPDMYIVCEQSVLVTIDGHEWYAPPQIYTHDDSSGLWTVKPALPPKPPLLSSGINHIESVLANHKISSNPSKAGLVEHRSQDIFQELADGVTSMESSYEHVADGVLSRDESDGRTKKRRVEEDLSANGIFITDCSLHEPREERLEEASTLEDAVLIDNQGSIAAAANASVAESVIEPTLVMFEVHVPSSCMLDGVHSQHFFGIGVITYHSQTMGLIVVDRNTVAISASEVTLSFTAFPIEIPGEVVFLHPVYNYALVAFDP